MRLGTLPLVSSACATLCVLATPCRHLEVARTLLQRGAAVNACTASGSTPLYSAAFRGQLQLVQVFLESGAPSPPPAVCALAVGPILWQ